MNEQNFDADQFAYLRGRSSTQAMLTVVKKSLVNGQLTGAVFYDFADAFGSVDRYRLLEKVRKDFNIVGLLFLHITSFLSGRRARIKIGELIGDQLESELGTSAGTWLGSLLFILHLHDVHSCIKPKFAEDLIAVSVGNTV